MFFTLLLVAGSGLLLRPLLRLRRPYPENALEIHRALRGYGSRLAVPAAPGDTAHEFLTAFLREIERRPPPGALTGLLAPVADQLRDLHDAYVAASYRPPASISARSQQLVQIWLGLRWRLWLLRIWSWLERRVGRTPV